MSDERKLGEGVSILDLVGGQGTLRSGVVPDNYITKGHQPGDQALLTGAQILQAMGGNIFQNIAPQTQVIPVNNPSISVNVVNNKEPDKK